MASSYNGVGCPQLLILGAYRCWLSGWNLTFDNGVETLDSLFSLARHYRYVRTTVRLDGTLAPEPTYPTAEQDRYLLAHAVLGNEEHAALALADEVQLRHASGDGFVSRRQLAGLLAEWAEYAASARRSRSGREALLARTNDLLRRAGH